MADQTCVVVGAGPGLGSALAQRFAEGGYNLALIARNAERMAPLVKALEAKKVKAKAYALDASDEGKMRDAFAAAEREVGPIAAAVHNVNGRVVKDLLDLTAADMESQWRAICLGGFLTAREAARHMLPRKAGTIAFIGGRGGRRGMAKFTAFAGAKAGVRSVAECVARELAPQGLHVAHFAVEATIGGEAARKRDPEVSAAEGLVDTAALAETVFQTHMQPRSCWTFEVDLRPWSEGFI